MTDIDQWIEEELAKCTTDPSFGPMVCADVEVNYPRALRMLKRYREGIELFLNDGVWHRDTVRMHAENLLAYDGREDKDE